MNLLLPDGLANRVRQQVEAGNFASEGEVLSEAVALLEERLSEQEALEQLLVAGVRSLDAGEGRSHWHLGVSGRFGVTRGRRLGP